MGNPLASWNGNLPSDVMLDSGVLYIGSTIFAAQDGGLKFDPGKELRAVPFDGQHSEVKGLDRTTAYMAKISGNIIQIPAATAAILEPGASTGSLTGAPTGLTATVFPKAAGSLYATNDYLSNVRAIWMRGDGTYVQVRFPAALVVKWDLTGQDKTEAKAAIEIAAKLDMAVSGQKVYNAPYVIEYMTAEPV